MRASLAALALATFALAGCKSDPYCLNCGPQSADGMPVLLDLTPGADLTELPDLLPPPDLKSIPDGGPCVPTNGGIEICDHLDNDCNGVTDDVSPSKLTGDPNNCGMCFNVCDYTPQHQFGACVSGTCMPSGCVPGYVKLPGHTACDYACTPSNGGVEICDGKDNNCDGQIDEPFTATYDSSGNPHYDKDPNNCGQCAGVCQLPGAVSQCTLDGTTMKGVCSVKSCINNVGVDTFTHRSGNINMTGCEYHCPFPSSTPGDCFVSPMSCTFPAEVCNGVDDDCNGITDDGPPPNNIPTDVGGPCGSCPGGTCKGLCHLGGLACVMGVKKCTNPTPVGPTIETCDTFDNDCNGLIDDGFTAPAPGGYADGNAGQMPLYNSDRNHCGSCMGANHTCALANATNGCHSASAGAAGTCFVVSCNNGFGYADKVGCGGGVGAENGPGGLGCYYACPVNPPSAEVCDGKDNNCNGCTDEGLTLPNPATFCANIGVCAAGGATVSCQGMAGIKCDYSMVANADFDPVTHALKPTETKCDNKDNNCNGITDNDGFPNKGNACSAGVGVCKGNGNFVCNGMGNGTICNAVAVPGNAVDELCNGKDDNCDGQTDERTPMSPGTCTNGGNHVCKGYADPMTKVGAVWVYKYEASRPDASGVSPGGNSARACSTAAVVPWSNVTETQAAAACAAIKDSNNSAMRLCSDVEWQAACEGPAPVPASPDWSQSSTRNAHVAGVCNDNGGTGAVWVTGFDNGKAQFCYTDWSSVDVIPPENANRVYDMSGNLFEWTQSTTVSQGTTYFNIRGGSFSSPQNGATCEFNFDIAQPGFFNNDLGFRCCADHAP